MVTNLLIIIYSTDNLTITLYKKEHTLLFDWQNYKIITEKYRFDYIKREKYHINN